MSKPTFIHFALPSVQEEESRAVDEVLRSGWLTAGPRTSEFEERFAVYARTRHALAVNSCTAGLHLALASLGLGPGDEVITTPMTFCATVNAILQVGASPVLADIDETLNISPNRIAKAITNRTRAIIPVHIAGLPCDMASIWAIARQHGLSVIEDAAHAAGSSYCGIPIGGGQSDAAAFSFYATKNLTTGEGGMLTTNSEQLYNRMKILCLHGISRDAWDRYTEQGNWYYEVVECGFKYNMSDIIAAIGLVQLQKLEQMTARRIEISRRYDNAFREIPELELPPDRSDSRHCWHLYILRLNLDRLTIDRAQFFREMRDRGIGCSVHFIPIPLHPYYRKVLEMNDPCARALGEYPRLLTLPLYPRMTDHDVQRVVEAVRDIGSRFKTRKQIPIPELAEA
jgi:dTDP-4-amino-4,6-dideoxygalactose transaminase